MPKLSMPLARMIVVALVFAVVTINGRMNTQRVDAAESTSASPPVLEEVNAAPANRVRTPVSECSLPATLTRWQQMNEEFNQEMSQLLHDYEVRLLVGDSTSP